MRLRSSGPEDRAVGRKFESRVFFFNNYNLVVVLVIVYVLLVSFILFPESAGERVLTHTLHLLLIRENLIEFPPIFRRGRRLNSILTTADTKKITKTSTLLPVVS